MQPTYLYTSDFDKEILWRSRFSTGVPIFLGFLQMLLTLAIFGLEVASVIISPIFATLYVGFWCSVVFVFSWMSMFGLACCHRARKWASFVFFISLLCAAAAIAVIVLDVLFIRNIYRCFFASVICDELKSYFPLYLSQPVESKTPFLKAQIGCAAAMLATAILYMLYYISASRGARRDANRVIVEHHPSPAAQVQQATMHFTAPQSQITGPAPVLYQLGTIRCPHCRSLIQLA